MIIYFCRSTLRLAHSVLETLRHDIPTRVQWWQENPDSFVNEVQRLMPSSLSSIGVLLRHARNVTIATGSAGTGSRIIDVEMKTPIQLGVALANRDPRVFGGKANSRTQANRFHPARSARTAEEAGGVEASAIITLPRSFTGWDARVTHALVRKLVQRKVKGWILSADKDEDGELDSKEAANLFTSSEHVHLRTRLKNLRNKLQDRATATLSNAFKAQPQGVQIFLSSHLDTALTLLGKDFFTSTAVPLFLVFFFMWSLCTTFGVCGVRLSCMSKAKSERAVFGHDRLSSWFAVYVLVVTLEQASLFLIPLLYNSAGLHLDNGNVFYLLSFNRSTAIAILFLVYRHERSLARGTLVLRGRFPFLCPNGLRRVVAFYCVAMGIFWKTLQISHASWRSDSAKWPRLQLSVVILPSVAVLLWINYDLLINHALQTPAMLADINDATRRTLRGGIVGVGCLAAYHTLSFVAGQSVLIYLIAVAFLPYTMSSMLRTFVEADRMIHARVVSDGALREGILAEMNAKDRALHSPARSLEQRIGNGKQELERAALILSNFDREEQAVQSGRRTVFPSVILLVLVILVKVGVDFTRSPALCTHPDDLKAHPAECEAGNFVMAMLDSHTRTL